MNDKAIAQNRPEWITAIAAAEAKFAAIAAADGNIVTYQREAMFAMQLISSKDALQKCEPRSIRNAVVNIASVGLTLNPAMKLAYLIPRNGECCLDISYIGLVKIATDSGSVLAVKAEVVCANDSFVYCGPFSMPDHSFDPFANSESRGEVIGAYAVAKLSAGFMTETLSRQEIDKIRSMSKAKSGPWFDWFEEMVKKSVIKRGSKMWPRTERLSQAETILNEHEGLIDSAITATSDATKEATANTAEALKERLGKAKPAEAKTPVTPEEEKAATKAAFDTDTAA